MPIIKSAKKRVRQDKKRHSNKLWVKRIYKAAIKEVRQNPTKKKLERAYSALDKAAKKRVVKKGKVSRLKSRLTSLVKKR